MADRFFFFRGRVALYAILMAMGVKEGDEIILPGFTCVAVPNAVIYLGAKPVYADIDPATYNIAPHEVRKKITKRTRAIIAQHTFGIPADMDRIKEIADENSLYLIEDACHSLGSRYKGRDVGSFGHAAFFSSQWSKPVTTGLGGWAEIRDENLGRTMNGIYEGFTRPSFGESFLLRLQYFVYSELLRPSLFWAAQDIYRYLSRKGVVIGSSSGEEFEGRMPARYEMKMGRWQKRVLNGRFEGADEVIRHRKRIASLYEELLTRSGLETVRLPGEYEPVFLRYPLLVRDRERVLRGARKDRIEIGDWFSSPVYNLPSGWEKVGYSEGTCPQAEMICRQIINLPTHQGIGEEEANRAVSFINNLR